MEEVYSSAVPSEQFSDELPEPLPVEGPEHDTNQTPVLESDFDKRNERLRAGAAAATLNQDEAAAAGMIALGDVLKQRQEAKPTMPPISQPYQAEAPPYSTPMLIPSSMPQSTSAQSSLPLRQQNRLGQAIAAGILAAIVVAPLVIYLLS